MKIPGVPPTEITDLSLRRWDDSGVELGAGRDHADFGEVGFAWRSSSSPPARPGSAGI
ncbi:hypothetical protein [Plantactinospora sp. KBS50]|uniref:hypothetical protein n=1 Tax=Plantactinospora sp. KBS50 TaxID=2024580 RepID=UPI0018DF04F5|nr:hypothetical protein [Plantactinospora sp. KBS50]